MPRLMVSLHVMNDSQDKLTYKKILVFWYPLALTWLMMAVENPFLTAIISRLPDLKINLAAFGVAYSFGLIVEAPVVMLMSASTALVTNRSAFLKLRRFTYALNTGVTLLLVVGIVPPIFNYIARDLIGLTPDVASLTHGAAALLLPWPAAIGYRRFYQGILIRSNLTRRVAYGTIVRLAAMAITAAVLAALGVHGAFVGTGALSLGVIAEAAASRIMAAVPVKELLAEKPDSDSATVNDRETTGEKTVETKGGKNGEPLTYTGIFKFYYPLALMTMLSFGVHPLVTFFVGKSPFAIESLAVLPVVNAFLFLFRSLGLSFTEVAVALLGTNNRNYIKIRNFATGLGVATAGLMIIVSFTPLVDIWYRVVAGLSAELTSFSIWPTRIVALLPGLAVLVALQRALVMSTKDTRPITRATILEVAVIIGTMLLLTRQMGVVGAVAASAAYTVGRLLANIYLIPCQLRAAAPPSKEN